jgi:hypothetical protein
MDRYTELYAWMWRSFGEEEFTIDTFRMVFPTSQAPKVMHDLAMQGYVSRVARGRYRLTEPGDFVRNVSGQEQDDGVLEEAGKDYAFCESRTLCGKVYVLHPRKSVRSEEKDGGRVVPLQEVVDFCLEREIAYEPALEYLDGKYGIGYPRREAQEG